MKKVFFTAVLLSIVFLFSCRKAAYSETDKQRPTRLLKEYFDHKYLLYRLPDTFYRHITLNNSFTEPVPSTVLPSGITISYTPLGYADSLPLQYTHIYSSNCVYHTNDSTWKYAEVSFPNTCLTNDKAYAEVRIVNSSNQCKQIRCRLFYQNTSYWYPTDKNIDHTNPGFLDNYYGCSELVVVNVQAQTDTTFKIAYSIGLNPKHEFDYDPSKDPARPGNYEFMLVVDEKQNPLLQNSIHLQQLNPFAEIQLNKGSKYHYLYTPSYHFKFVFLDEFFDGTNDLHPSHIYIAKHGKEKKLCDTCSHWYRGVLSEIWNSDDYFKGFISKTPFVKACLNPR
jgi:hypothetical protein